MQIRALILDFDGTLVAKDVSDVLCDLVGKRAESEELNRLFQIGELRGLEGLVRRINFLNGLPVARIEELVASQNYLRPGAIELFAWARAHNVITIIASGSTLPLLSIYQRLLGADFIVGSKVAVQDGKLAGISAGDYSGADFKVRDSSEILSQHMIRADQTVALGDSSADRGIFELAARSIAVEPKAGIEAYATITIGTDLHQAIEILDDWTS